MNILSNRRSKGRLSPFAVFQCILQVKVHALGGNPLHPLQRFRRQHDNRYSRRTCERLLGSNHQYIDTAILHVYFVSQERTDGINDKKQPIATTEIPNQIKVVTDTGRGLVDIYNEGSIASYTIKAFQIVSGHRTPRRRYNPVEGHTMDLAKLAEPATKASPVDHKRLVARIQKIHHNGFHGSRARAGDENRTRTLRGSGKLQHQTLVLQHNLGKLRRTKIRHLLSSYFQHRSIRLNRTYGKVNHTTPSSDRRCITAKHPEYHWNRPLPYRRDALSNTQQNHKRMLQTNSTTPCMRTVSFGTLPKENPRQPLSIARSTLRKPRPACPKGVSPAKSIHMQELRASHRTLPHALARFTPPKPEGRAR